MTMRSKNESTPGATFAVRHRANVASTRNNTKTEPMPDTDLPYYQTGSSITFGRKHTRGTLQFAQPHTELLFDDALKMFDGNKRVVEEIKDYYIVDDDKVQPYVKFLGEQQTIWIDYKVLYEQCPEAVSAYFRQSDLPFLYPNGVVGTETLIPEEEDEDDYLNTTNNAGGEQTNINNTENEQYSITNEGGEYATETNDETNDATEASDTHDVEMEEDVSVESETTIDR
jgi:hypothetical protein